MKPQYASRQGPQAWHPASEDVKAACRKAAARAAERVVDLPTLAIKAAMQEPRIATSLVGFCRAEEVREKWEWAANMVCSACVVQATWCI